MFLTKNRSPFPLSQGRVAFVENGILIAATPDALNLAVSSQKLSLGFLFFLSFIDYFTICKQTKGLD